jgi:hypothetical protein
MQTAPEQDGSPAVAKPTPLFRIDPGWPFVIAGLLLLVAGVLIPAQRDLQELRNTLEIHRALEDQSIRQLAAYDRFLNDLDHGDEQLVGRLAASQLNLMPKDERSMLLVPTLNATVTQWIEDSEPAILPNPPAYPDTLLSRLATGPRRLWVLACGAFLVFVGLMLSPSAPSSRRGARRPETEPSPGPSPAPMPAVAMATAVAAASTLVVDDSVVDDSVVDDSDASSEEHEAQAAEEAAVAVLDQPAPSSRLDEAFGAIDAEAAVAEVESEAELDVEDDREVDVEDDVDGEDEDEREVEVEVEVDSSEDESFACVDGEVIEMPESVLAADAEAVCMSEMTRASGAGAVIVEPKQSASDEQEAAALPKAESIATIDGGSVVESVARAETEALRGEVEPEGEDEPSLPCATDRALDALSLFHGLSEDRWISTAGRS